MLTCRIVCVPLFNGGCAFEKIHPTTYLNVKRKRPFVERVSPQIVASRELCMFTSESEKIRTSGFSDICCNMQLTIVVVFFLPFSLGYICRGGVHNKQR